MEGKKMSYLERWSATRQAQLEEKRFKAEQLREAKRLITVNALSWDGENWKVYPVCFNVRMHGEEAVCDCKVYREHGFCSHGLAVELKEESAKK